MADKKILVAYFSCSGVTMSAAEEIADVLKADLGEIMPEKPYTAADLDWRDKKSRSTIEMNDDKCRPAMAAFGKDVSKYDVVFLGFPVWWDITPRIIDTFLEKYDLSGKTIVPFATSGGSTIRGSVEHLRKLYGDKMEIKDGRTINGFDPEEFESWVKELGI